MPPLEFSNGPAASAETPQSVLDRSRERQDGLLVDIEQPLQRRAMDFANAVPALRQGLRNDSAEVQDEMEAIFAGLLDPRPEYGEPPTEELNRYLTCRELKNAQGDTVYAYGIKPGVVERDLAFLTNLQGVHPELAGQLAQVKASLTEYARRDERMVSHELGKARRESYTSQALGQMGKTAGFIACAFAATVTGILMISNMVRNKGKGLSAAPFLYGGIAALIASGSLRKSIFGTGAEKALAPLDKAINQSPFNRLAKTYDIQGTAWRSVTDELMQEDAVRAELLKQMEDGKAAPEDVRDHINGLTSDTKVRQRLFAMVENGDYVLLATILKNVDDPTSQDVMLDYVKNGAWKYAR